MENKVSHSETCPSSVDTHPHYILDAIRDSTLSTRRPRIYRLILKMASLEELIRAQDNTYTLICHILTNYEKFAKSKRTVNALRSRLNNLQDYWKTCQKQHSKHFLQWWERTYFGYTNTSLKISFFINKRLCRGDPGHDKRTFRDTITA